MRVERNRMDQGGREGVDLSSGTTIIRLRRVMERTGLSRSSIYARIAEERFPAPVRLGARAVGWVEGEVEAWIRSKIEARASGD